MADQETSVAVEAPTSVLGEPPVALEAPTPVLEEPLVALEAPTPVLGEPPVAVEAPIPVLGEPPVALEAPTSVLGEPPVAVEAPTPVLGEPMDLMTALQFVIKKSGAHDGLVKGLSRAAKVIDKHAAQAQLCVLAEDCEQFDYVKLVKALCSKHNVHLITVPSAKVLGEWAGLYKIDSESKARKVVGCSCVVVKDYGEKSEGLNIVQEYVKSL